MSATGAALAGRGFAERELMTDTCTITRASGDPVFDPNTGTYTDPAPTTLYEGACRVKPRDNADRVVDAGGQAVTLLSYIISVSVTDVEYAVDDLVTVTASAGDPALVGLRLRVRAPMYGSQITARRLGCEVDAG